MVLVIRVEFLNNLSDLMTVLITSVMLLKESLVLLGPFVTKGFLSLELLLLVEDKLFSR